MNKNTINGAGLRGQVAGQTSLCTVGKTGSGLTYRGHDISILAEKAKFEEVAYLLLYNKLPNQVELDKWIINEAKILQKDVLKLYESYSYHKAIQKIHNFCVNELGGVYLDIVKDRLYTCKSVMKLALVSSYRKT